MDPSNYPVQSPILARSPLTPVGDRADSDEEGSGEKGSRMFSPELKMFVGQRKCHRSVEEAYLGKD